jgi:hydrogenase maturation protease
MSRGSAARVARPLEVVVLGCGNPSRGDDGLGPALMARVREWIEAHPGRPVIAVEDFQLQVEHTLDLVGRDLALFVDATASGLEPVTLHLVEPAVGASFTTHALSPGALLQAYLTLDRGVPPRAFALAVRGTSFGLGPSLSPEGSRSLETAWILLERLLASPSIEEWERWCTREAEPRPDARHAAPPIASAHQAPAA